MRIVVATHNKGKLVELRQLLDVPGLEIVGVDQSGVTLPDVEETGDTYEANALLKARGIAAHLRGRGECLVLADDSGIEVDALGGAPGVHSARYAGDAGPRANTEKLLASMRDVPDDARAARFRCVIVLVHPDHPDDAFVVSGRCEGSVAHAPRGGGGFGYDPIFEVAPSELAELAGRTREDHLTMAELDEHEKNQLSHRGRAVREARARWSEIQRLASSR